MRDVLLLVDVFDDFEHDDGDALEASFLQHLPALAELVAAARVARIPAGLRDGAPDLDCRSWARAGMSRQPSVQR